MESIIYLGRLRIACETPKSKTTTYEFTLDVSVKFTFTCGINMTRGEVLAEVR